MGFDFFSPGCNCKATFTSTGPCSGVITWCTKPNATVIVQKKTGSTWNDVAVVLPTDPQQYPVDSSQTGTYRIKCVLCNNQASTSAEIQAVVCGTHSYWFRLARMNCTMQDFIICPNFPAYYALKTVIVMGVPRLITQCYNCLGEEIFPVSSQGFYVSAIQVISGTHIKLYSISHTAYNYSREGYTFDFRYLGQSLYPNCGGSGSWFSYFYSPSGYGLYSMGRVTFTRNVALNWKLIGEAEVGDPYWNLPTTPESGSWAETLTQATTVTVWFNPYGAGNSSVGYTGPGVAWNDGTYMGNFDQSGNSLGLIFENTVINRTYSGTRPPSYANDWYAFGPDSIALASPWPARRYGREPLTEFKVRSCNEALLGINPLPPSSVVACPWDGAPDIGRQGGAWLP